MFDSQHLLNTHMYCVKLFTIQTHFKRYHGALSLSNTFFYTKSSVWVVKLMLFVFLYQLNYW